MVIPGRWCIILTSPQPLRQGNSQELFIITGKRPIRHNIVSPHTDKIDANTIVVVVPHIELVPPQLIILEVLQEAVMYLRTHDPGIVPCAFPRVLDDCSRRLVDVRLWAQRQPTMAFEGCFESFFDLVVFIFSEVGMNGVVGGAVPGGEFGGAPGGFLEGEVDEVGWWFQFRKVGANGIEVEVDPGKCGLVYDVC